MTKNHKKPKAKPGDKKAAQSAQAQQERRGPPPVEMMISPDLFQQMPKLFDAAIRQIGADAAMTVAGMQVAWNVAANKYNERVQMERFQLHQATKDAADKLNARQKEDGAAANDSEPETPQESEE